MKNNEISKIYKMQNIKNIAIEINYLNSLNKYKMISFMKIHENSLIAVLKCLPEYQ